MALAVALIVLSPWLLSMLGNKIRKNRLISYLGEEPDAYATVGVTFGVLRELMILRGSPFIPVLYGTHLALTADKNGICLYVWAWRPRELCRINWNQIIQINKAEKSWGNSMFPAVDCNISQINDSGTRRDHRLLMCVLPQTGLGYTPPQEKEFDAFYKSLLSSRATDLYASDSATRGDTAAASAVFVSMVKGNAQTPEQVEAPVHTWVNRTDFERMSAVRSWGSADSGTGIDANGALYRIEPGSEGLHLVHTESQVGSETATQILQQAIRNLTVYEQRLNDDLEAEYNSSIVEQMNAEHCWGALMYLLPPKCDNVKYRGYPLETECKTDVMSVVSPSIELKPTSTAWPLFIISYLQSDDDDEIPFRISTIVKTHDELLARRTQLRLDQNYEIFDQKFVPYRLLHDRLRPMGNDLPDPESFSAAAKEILTEQWVPSGGFRKTSQWKQLPPEEALMTRLTRFSPVMLQGVLMYQSMAVWPLED